VQKVETKLKVKFKMKNISVTKKKILEIEIIKLYNLKYMYLCKETYPYPVLKVTWGFSYTRTDKRVDFKEHMRR